MDTQTTIRLGLRRVVILFIISLGVVFAGSEAAFRIQKETYDRAPTQVDLLIPLGTAAAISRGESVPTIPEEMVFVTGDTLLVRNEDEVDHQLGPLWIPAKSTASLVMEVPDQLAYSCSFQPDQYLGLDIRKPTTIATRLTALALAVPATTAFLFVYSLVISPLKSKQFIAESSDTSSPRPSGEK
jgi:hypothetical protein